MALKCTKCTAVFPEDEAWSRKVPVRSEFWGVAATTYETQYGCPTCGALDPIDVIGCDRCGHAEALSDDDYCAPCAAIVDAEDQQEAEANRRLGIAA